MYGVRLISKDIYGTGKPQTMSLVTKDLNLQCKLSIFIHQVRTCSFQSPRGSARSGAFVDSKDSV